MKTLLDYNPMQQFPLDHDSVPLVKKTANLVGRLVNNKMFYPVDFERMLPPTRESRSTIRRADLKGLDLTGALVINIVW